MGNRGSILQFQAVSFGSSPWYDTPLRDAYFSIEQGELLLLHFESYLPHTPLPDLASGVISPDDGVVRFDGRDWNSLNPRQASQRRAGIGRLFAGSFVNHLDVQENVSLRVRHHKLLPPAQWQKQLNELTEQMGLRHGLPEGRPSQANHFDLQRAACVRMLLANPLLLVVDEPASGLLEEVSQRLLPLVSAARTLGTSVLWLTTSHEVPPAMRPTHRGKITGGMVVMENEVASEGNAVQPPMGHR